MKTKLGAIVHQLELVEQALEEQPPRVFFDTHFLMPCYLVKKWTGFARRYRRPPEQENVQFYQRLTNLANHNAFVVTPKVFEEYTDRNRHNIHQSHSMFELAARLRLETSLRNTIYEPEKDDLYGVVDRATNGAVMKYLGSGNSNDATDAELLKYSFHDFVKNERSTYVLTADRKLRLAIHKVACDYWQWMGGRPQDLEFRVLENR